MPSYLSHVTRFARVLIAGSVLAVIVAGPVAAQTTATSFSGDATGVIALVNNPLGGPPLVDQTLVEAGPLPSAGGSDQDSLANAAIGNVLTASAISADTNGAGNTAESNAEILDLALSVSGLDVTSSTLSSNAVATCGSNGATVSGDSVVEDLTIDGTTIVVSGDANQTVNLPGGITVIINEQATDVAADGSTGEVTVNALHITIEDPISSATLVDVILSQSHADVTCLPDSATDGPVDAMLASTGGPGNTIPLALALLVGLAVSMMLVRPLLRR